MVEERGLATDDSKIDSGGVTLGEDESRAGVAIEVVVGDDRPPCRRLSSNFSSWSRANETV